jgi:hypothetical protein
MSKEHYLLMCNNFRYQDIVFGEVDDNFFGLFISQIFLNLFILIFRMELKLCYGIIMFDFYLFNLQNGT